MRPIKFANDKADVLHIARYEYRTCALEHIWPRLLEDGSTYPPDKRFAPVCAGKHKHRRLAILTFAMMLCTLVITGCHGRGHQEPNGQDALARFMRKESEGAHDQRVVAYPRVVARLECAWHSSSPRPVRRSRLRRWRASSGIDHRTTYATEPATSAAAKELSCPCAGVRVVASCAGSRNSLGSRARDDLRFVQRSTAVRRCGQRGAGQRSVA